MEYRLQSIVAHTGSLYKGHYTAYGKKNDQWYYFDDIVYR
jgi:ubiquitin C-terminal hydrolase